jgi:uncharacterized protein
VIASQRRRLDGPVGPIEIAIDWPAHAPTGLAVVGHPHPLYGGTLDNKVAATLARTFAGEGWLALRPNFRGVGASAGSHDEGRGESDDLLHLIDAAPRWLAGEAALDGLPLALAGFSFGSYVVALVARRLHAQGRAASRLVLVGTAAGKWPMPEVDAETLAIRGELDETIPLADVLNWARPQQLPVVVLPGADHFFHRRLGQLKRLVVDHLNARSARPKEQADPTTADTE